ncbi:putative transmembrane protein [Trypanosoma theileri]|uniref:Putative transmembrane protein n=1 Tax=Trypanosoma theileri TaxID=67003 RepID=A0A1X0P7R7_9TRYP|nr:putative transmembrane protein [Trypanosoma theileri]ORC92974.1 putative transmembrane protein [Trypanosoma theileri]
MRRIVPVISLTLWAPNAKRHHSDKEEGVNTETPLPDPLAREKEVDPFRVGYNMGMQSVHLEAIRMKLNDHLELFKSHFRSLSDILKSNHDQVKHLQVQNSNIISHEVKELNNHFLVQLSAIEQHVNNLEKTLKGIIDDRVAELQRHIDDSFENLKDTVKLGFAVLLFFNLWMFYTISQNHRQQMNARTSHTVSELSSRMQK